jgi:hypothetical protein
MEWNGNGMELRHQDLQRMEGVSVTGMVSMHDIGTIVEKHETNAITHAKQ